MNHLKIFNVLDIRNSVFKNIEHLINFINTMKNVVFFLNTQTMFSGNSLIFISQHTDNFKCSTSNFLFSFAENYSSIDFKSLFP